MKHEEEAHGCLPTCPMRLLVIISELDGGMAYDGGVMAKQRRKPGDVVQIDLGDGTHTYAWTWPTPCLAFYDLKVMDDVEAAEVVRHPVLFVVAVMKNAVTSGRWKIVGHVPLGPEVEVPPRFKQDALRPDQFSIYHRGVERPATREECEGLERLAVWDATHVEERLRDHFAGRPNIWVESLKIR